MKTKRITKAVHLAFIAALASECEAVGIEAVPHPYKQGAPAYSTLTRLGRYNFHPSMPIAGMPRQSLDVTVFGRFEENLPAIRAISGGSGKWNFHAGYCTELEAIEYATEIVTRIITV